MVLKLPITELDEKNSVEIEDYFVPYPKEYYGCSKQKKVRALKTVADEVQDLLRRYVIVYPETVNLVREKEKPIYRCMVLDEKTGISRGILERMGYELVESELTPFSLYWIDLKTNP